MQSHKLATPSAAITLNAHDLARLRTLLPLRHLRDTEFETIAAHVDVETYAATRELFRVGRDEAWIFYLLDGAVDIADESGEQFTVTAGSIEALHPLSPHAKTRVTARARTVVRVVRLPATASVAKPSIQTRTGIEVVELSDADDDIDHRLLFSIYHALREERLVLPRLPDVAVRIRAVADDERNGVNEIASILQTDPGLAAYCINIANSAPYAGSARVTDLREAVAQIGIAAVRDFITAYALRGMFKTSEPRCAEMMRLAWQHAAEIGALSYVIARRLTQQNPEQALLAGLVHELGVMVVLSELPKHPALLCADDTLRVVLRELKHQTTALVLRAWKLPETFIKASFAAEHWSRISGSNLDLCDTLLLAHWHEPVRDLPWADPRPAQCAVVSGLAPDTLNEHRRLQILEEARDELATLTSLLGFVTTH